MERGPHLRATVNRKLRVTGGEGFIDNDRLCYVLPGFECVDVEGKERKRLNPGDSAVLTANASLQIVDRVLTLRPHPELYKNGYLTGMNIVTPKDGQYQPTFEFTATKRIDISKLGYLVEVYIGN